MAAYVGMALFVGTPRVIGWLTDTPSQMSQVRLSVQPGEASATLAVFATVVVALTVTSRAASGVPAPGTIARERAWDNIAHLLGAASAFVTTGVLVGGLSRPDQLVISLALTAVGGALTMVSVSATPQNSRDLALWARRLRGAEVALQLDRYVRVEARWSGEAGAPARRWVAYEVGRWWLATTVTVALVTHVLGDAPTAIGWIGGSATLSAGAVILFVFVLHYIGDTARALVDRDLVGATSSALLAAAFLLLAGILGAALALGPDANRASAWLVAALTAELMVVGSLTTILGARNRYPRWRWFRPGLYVRTTVLQHCRRRQSALRTQQQALVYPRGITNSKRPRWPRARAWYNHMSGLS